MREKRDQLFNKHRIGLETNSKPVQDTLTEIVRQEFKNLTSSDNNGTSFILEKIDEPLTEEETIKLENEIVYEEGLNCKLSQIKICHKILH